MALGKRPIPDLAVTLIKESEGCKLSAYQCPAGVWTIGYGHTAGVVPGLEVTEATANDLLVEDLQHAAGAVDDCVIVPLSDGQRAALISFVFNIGAHNFRGSTLLRRLNHGEYGAVPEQLARWVKAKGRTLPGLVARREKEAAVWAAS